MSLLSDIKFFVKKYLKNPVVVVALSYIIYKFIRDHQKKESLSETIQVVNDNPDKPYSIIHDDKTNKYILIYNTKVYSSDSAEELENFVKKLIKGD